MTSCSKLNVARPSTTDRVLPSRSRSRSRFSTQATPSSTLKESPYELAEYCVKQTRIHLFFSNLDPLRGLWELALAYPLYLLKPESIGYIMRCPHIHSPSYAPPVPRIFPTNILRPTRLLSPHRSRALPSRVREEVGG